MENIKFKHTPGPWKYGVFENVHDGFENLSVHPVTNNPFATPICQISPVKKINEADVYNAKLIAAAPEMKDALVKIIEAKDRAQSTEDLLEVLQPINSAREVIKKATE
jgi:hypothetical protein